MEVNNKYLALGLMSGTSYDGIDAGLIETDGHDYIKLLETFSYVYPDNTRDDIANLMGGNYTNIWQIEKSLSQLHAEIAKKFTDKYKIDVIGFHGQAIYHNPEDKITIQLGNPHIISQLTKVNVVYDFRRQDVALGGQGAPLVPIFLKGLDVNKSKPYCFLNIGGVSNICYIGEVLIAFDTGPGNAPLNDICKLKLGINFDDGGNIASGGKCNTSILKELLTNDYFKKPYPKSLDRNHFNYNQLHKISIPDALATIVEFIAYSIKEAIDLLPSKPQEIIVSGGGAQNKYLLKRIENVTNIKVALSDKYNIDSNFVEAYAFGYLAVRSMRNLPISFPLTTGVVVPCCGGILLKC